MFLSLLMVISILIVSVVPVAAANVSAATIDYSKTASLSIYKYDFTNAAADGVWTSSYISTGLYDEYVNNTLGGATRKGASDENSLLGNGETSLGYAIKGVEFTYLRIADIYTYSGTEDGTQHVELLYGFQWNTNTQALLAVIGLDENDRYAPADQTTGGATMYYYQSDVLIDALSDSLTANATAVKNALERFVKENGGTAMEETDATGYTTEDALDLGLYLVVETKVPEMVTSTVNPFFVSLPMTSVDGSVGASGTTAENYGGSEWLYDVTLYPKNSTGIPTLEKTVRESQQDTGTNNASATDIADGYKHHATASGEDLLEYQIISTLPSITSSASYLSDYTFTDTLSEGISYNQDVVITIYKDAKCTEKITEWTLFDEVRKYSVTYDTLDTGESTMTVALTDDGVNEINTANTVYTDAGSVHSGYSDCTIRITYTANLNSNNSVVYGDKGNPNSVALLWKRTNTSYYDLLTDDCHVYTYAIDLTKKFSDDNGDYSKVEFVLYNETDDYYVQAEVNEEEGIYYVVDNAAEADHSCSEEDATHFIPIESSGVKGKIIIKGLENDVYTLTELRTDNKYTLLQEDIQIDISTSETTDSCTVYSTDLLGVIQNDPRYQGKILKSQQNERFTQPTPEHRLLTASATVNNDAVTMLTDGDSDNAAAALGVVNTRGFDIPSTGGSSALILTICGAALVTSGVLCIVILLNRRKQKKEN